MRLLCACWLSGDCSLPNDSKQLSLLSGLPEQELEFVLGFFVQHPHKDNAFTNERLLKEWEKATRLSVSRSQAGRKSGKSRRTHVQQVYEQKTNKIRTFASISESESESESELRFKNKEEEGSAEGNAVRVSRKRSQPAAIDSEWLEGLQRQEVYQHLSINAVHQKAWNWCQVNNKKCTRKFFINWLNREPVPMQPPQPKPVKVCL